MTPNYDKLRRLRSFDERTGWPIANDELGHSHIGIAFLPTRQRLGQKALSLFCLYFRPIHTRKFGHLQITPRMQCYQTDAATRGFVKCNPRSEL